MEKYFLQYTPGVIQRLITVVLTLVALAALMLAAVFLLLWREHNTPVALPTPTGSYAVGRASYLWVNNSVTDALSPNGSEKETVVVWIWYPAEPDAQSRRADYLPEHWQAALAAHSGKLLTFLARDPNRVRVYSTINSPLSPARPSYPVVIMRAGGAALTTDYTSLAEDLASHGYVVVGLDAPYRTTVVVLPGGHVIERVPSANLDLVDDAGARRMAEKLLPMWTGDIRFVLHQLEALNASDPSGRFTGRLDLSRLGIFGHSFGGAQALQFCHDDSRCRAAIDIDGIAFGSVVQRGLDKPGLILMSDHSREMSDPESGEIISSLKSVYGRFPMGLFATIRGANHFSFSDQILLRSHLLISALMAVRVFGHLQPRRGLAIAADYVHTFFDVYLKGASPSQFANLTPKYPEVQVESH